MVTLNKLMAGLLGGMNISLKLNKVFPTADNHTFVLEREKYFLKKSDTKTMCNKFDQCF